MAMLVITRGYIWIYQIHLQLQPLPPNCHHLRQVLSINKDLGHGHCGNGPLSSRQTGQTEHSCIRCRSRCNLRCPVGSANWDFSSNHPTTIQQPPQHFEDFRIGDMPTWEMPHVVSLCHATSPWKFFWLDILSPKKTRGEEIHWQNEGFLQLGMSENRVYSQL